MSLHHAIIERTCRWERITLADGTHGTITHERCCGGTVYGYRMTLPDGSERRISVEEARSCAIPSLPVTTRPRPALTLIQGYRA